MGVGLPPISWTMPVRRADTCMSRFDKGLAVVVPP
jgi:hypothetical protein